MLLQKPTLYTDFYELTMAQGYFLSGRHQQPANFDYFFRSLPFKGGYVIFAGLSDLLEIIENFTFHEDELAYLKEQGFKSEFLSYLKDFQFQGDIYSVKEGEVIFANEPVLRVEGNILETQILETVILNTLNFESLIATKASRIKLAAGDKSVLDFGLRRSQGLGGLQASKASVIGGIGGSSNVLSGKMYDIDVSGTMAHSWVQSFGDEITAFRTYARHYPDASILLVDTYDTLKSGVPNAIKVAKELEEKGHKLIAIRLDSGDLAYLARQSRNMLDNAGLDYVKIAASNQLDEYVIKSLQNQNAPIDLFGVGTKLVTAYDDPALDGVYKLSSINGNPTLKISENIEKITLPDTKKIVRYLNEDGSFYCDGVLLEDEGEQDVVYHPHVTHKSSKVAELKSETLLSKIVDQGRVTIIPTTPKQSAAYARERLTKLNQEHKRFDNPHVYKVGVSKKLRDLKDQLVQKG
ncbi:nicotinate phosphoribosyltransferase [Gracilimonas sediminicola]|uniref:Nicotinate phosphoribosyltransferase n=1 Tax=Gracilimonas sediminicola TaxID=2952158 RepID=A0A9X2L625_9BACT|nr:nicotinate phosphoribosyltransferase [Gracilimonas sediminicola]MCP9292997.1 nicotinate phosphoribosyltransferase [Gracilimonas sediminicola]